MTIDPYFRCNRNDTSITTKQRCSNAMDPPRNVYATGGP